MARYVLIPGAGGESWYWHRIIPLLQAAGHHPIAVDLPGDDQHAGLAAYTELVLAAIDHDPHAIVVAQSLGGFTAAMVCERTHVAGLVLVNAMIPLPGETAGAWGKAVGSTEARIAAARRHGYSEEFEDDTYFFHDVPPDVIAAGKAHQRGEAEEVFDEPCAFTAWPAIPIRVLGGAEDRLFPIELQRRIARERLGRELEVIPGGHLGALSRPAELVAACCRRGAASGNKSGHATWWRCSRWSRCGTPGQVTAPVLTPGARQVTTSDGVKLHVEVAGTGPACLVVHGGPGQGTASFAQMGADALEKFLTLVYVDQRGSGRSPDAANYKLDRVVQDFEEVRAELGVARPCLIAHSFGGILAVAYARRFPDHVSALVLANATLEFLGPDNMKMQTRFIDQLLGRPATTFSEGADVEALREPANEARAALMKAGLGYRLISEQVSAIQRMSEIDASYERSRGFGRAVLAGIDDPMAVGRRTYPEYYADHAPETAEIRQPVLVITGAKDFAVGPDEYKRFRFPDQQVVVLPTGHMPYHEATAEFAAAIRTFAEARLIRSVTR